MEFKEITHQSLAGVDTVQYSELPQVKICPIMLDTVATTIYNLLVQDAPYNYKRELINMHLLWFLSNGYIEDGVMKERKFQGQSIWEGEALLTYIENKTNPDIKRKFKGIQLEHNNERIWYTDQLQALDIESPDLKERIKNIVKTTTCTVVTPEFHNQLPNSITDPNDPFKRYRGLEPILYWLDWVKVNNRWKIDQVRKIVY